MHDRIILNTLITGRMRKRTNIRSKIKHMKINFRSQKGFTLVEILVAVALLSIIGVGLLAALGGASKVLIKADIRETARDLAQAQMEYVQSVEYNADDPEGNKEFYPKIEDLSTKYPGFDVEITAERIDKDYPPDTSDDDGIQEITIVVKHGSKIIFTLTGMKVKL